MERSSTVERKEGGEKKDARTNCVLFSIRNLSMARKTADADVDSLPLSLLPRFASISSTFARREKSDGIHVRDGRHTIILFDIFSLVRTFRRSKLTNR